MGHFVITGGKPLKGEISLQGAKNAVLPILAATVLINGTSELHNCPALRDVTASLKILRYLGCKAEQTGDVVTVDASQITGFEVSDDLMREMRSSFVFVGAMAARCGFAEITYPGGCELGARPIDLHLKAFRAMGMKITEEHGKIYCDARRLRPAAIHLDFPSVGATENIMLAAVFTPGVTRIVNAAKEPEIEDLQNFLNRAGAKIYGAGGSEIYIEGVPSLKSVTHRVIPDRIVGATYLMAAAVTRGELLIRNIEPSHMDGILPVLEECGCEIGYPRDGILNIKCKERMGATDKVRTLPYPGFPTDAQAPLMAMLATACGSSMITETIFESRFKHVEELIKMGANIKTDGRVAVIRGVRELSGAEVTAGDLRGGAALMLAALGASGTSKLHKIELIDRGYEAPESILASLGAKIKRVE
ncbi:MAG: UDP-N-acetylglucosamine 1-carboxyvinyltransferase [Ruminococcaceae bacterium]|nr:UDP-N-acetylglucosamine 1-carboxyvinyltransferase [Oscillospiraceae bacterium]